ncbi:hypothetical protein AB1Y20_005264 [Prymnesium parvum]|uniref:Uncharacterized protein n=1 Tax=Prymnesium parvum TaxID=97485 RepID=A0AB34J3M8_PRYPA
MGAISPTVHLWCKRRRLRHWSRRMGVEEPEEEIHYVKKAKSAPKKPKRRIVVVEESSDDEEEIEVRLPPKRKGKRATRAEYDDGDERYEKTMRDLFSL